MPVASPYAARLAAIPVERKTLELPTGPAAYWVYGDAAAPLTLTIAA